MKRITFLISLLFGFPSLQAQEWTSTIKSGVSVKSKIYDQKMDGKDVVAASYIATKTADFSLDQAEQFLRKPTNYQQFLENTKESKEVKKINANEWVTYLYFDAPWPAQDSDCIQTFTMSRKENSLSLSAKSTPGAYPPGSLKRMKTFNAVYRFDRISDTQTKLTITATFIPVGNVRKWMLNTWFPKGPAGIVNRLIVGISR